MENIESPAEFLTQWECPALDVAQENMQDAEAEVVGHGLERD